VADVGGALELAIMESLWAAPGPMRVRELQTELNADAERPLAYNTVQTVAERLTRKGLLRKIPDGPAFRYYPTRSREDYTASLVLDVLGDAADRGAVFARLAETMDPDDARQLLDALRKRTGDEGGK
jgi:predicted transcriptional regulator